jgi:Uri superfamily endonuclease
MVTDAPGTYVLVLELPAPATIEIGALGSLSFTVGSYAYVGSAMNGLRQRIARHLRRDKKTYWHIDYFLREAAVTRVWHALYEQRECDIAAALAASFAAIEGFGCSDCRCRSHLFYVSQAGMFHALEVLGLSSSLPEEWR